MKTFKTIFTIFVIGYVFSTSANADYRDDLSNLTPEDSAWVQDSCKYLKSQGPSSYIHCIKDQIYALQEDAKRPVKAPTSQSNPELNQVQKNQPTSNPTNQNNAKLQNVQEEDLNVDYAIIKSPKANLRGIPDIKGDLITSLKQGDIVVLLDSQAKDGWFNVLDVASSNEGWINEATIKISFTKNPKNTQLFQAESLPYFSEPEIVIENASAININLKIGSQLIIIPANSSKSIKIGEGSYKYYASAPGVFPSLGTQIFDNSHRYSWKFWIETSYGSRSRKARR